jgi:triphosphatase
MAKAERGYRLLGAAPDVPRAVTVTLNRDMTVETALQHFGQQCLSHLLRNEPVMLADEAEGIHQMRVAVQRLRSVLSALKQMLPMEHHRWASEELKWLTHSLAPARNLDIFVGDLLRTVSDALPSRSELEHLVRAADRCRRAAFDDAKQAILSERYTSAMLRLLRWFAARDSADIGECNSSSRLDRQCWAWRNVSTTLKQPAFEFKLGFSAFGLAG